MNLALLGSKDFEGLEYNLNTPLVFLEHDVFNIDVKDVVKIPYRFNYWATKFFHQYDLSIFKKIAAKILKLKPELIIYTYRFIHPECIKILKKNLSNTPVIHVNPDSIITFEDQQIFASPYDAYFTKDPFIVDFMKNKINLNTFYLPEALNARLHIPPENIDRKILEERINIDVVGFGTMYPYRTKMIFELIKSGIAISLFGSPEKRFPRKEVEDRFQNEFIKGKRKAEVLYGSKIIFNNFHYSEIMSANAKFFEIYGIGGFQICDFKPTLRKYSATDVEQFSYKNIAEAIDKIKYYLRNPEERYSIAEKQQKHFHANHTYEHRIKTILNLI